ncbi:hypothetical protein F5B20DRAFT_569835 [Whalleya microplaca]|nr:hypothetical protein F5B20DRAFT_569835 [Whalleya microplaca]
MAQPNYSILGWVYIVLCAIWTAFLAVGILFLHRHRQLPFLQMRKLPLVFAAIILLHSYSAICMFLYTFEPVVPCNVQFWVMSIHLPFGMALLQAANSQFQHIASQQRKYAQFGNIEEYRSSEKSVPIDASLVWWRRMVRKIKREDKPTRTVIFISIGMVAQFLLSIFVYFGSEMFHPSYGFFHVEVPGAEQRKIQCLKGWEWWPSIVWQAFWAWCYAPYMLWRTRYVRDSHGWRIQTICCCIAGLPATPLWLAGLYIPQMTPVNAVIIPPQWFSLSIFLIEVFTIFFPCWQVTKTHKLQRETLDAIAAWERRTKGHYDSTQIATTLASNKTTLQGSPTNKNTKTKTNISWKDPRKSETLTMAALESTLTSDPHPLLEFAALKDFAGENISFLSHVNDWKLSWAKQHAEPGQGREQQFACAVRIYAHSVSLAHADFPVNISSRAASDLHSVFGAAARGLDRAWSLQSGGGNSATPFDGVSSTASLKSEVELEDTLGQANLQAVGRMAEEFQGEGVGDMRIPESFGPQVFDAAESEIKYLVLTNTWPKFVHSRYGGVCQTARKDESHFLDGARKYLCGLERIV